MYRFELPERPSALPRFLGQMPPDWNISLFDYRNHGANYGPIPTGTHRQLPEGALYQKFWISHG